MRLNPRDQQLLAETYSKVLGEHQADTGADEQLKKELIHLIVQAVKGEVNKLSEGLVERNAPALVDRMMASIQHHIGKQSSVVSDDLEYDPDVEAEEFQSPDLSQ